MRSCTLSFFPSPSFHWNTVRRRLVYIHGLWRGWHFQKFLGDVRWLPITNFQPVGKEKVILMGDEIIERRRQKWISGMEEDGHGLFQSCDCAPLRCWSILLGEPLVSNEGGGEGNKGMAE